MCMQRERWPTHYMGGSPELSTGPQHGLLGTLACRKPSTQVWELWAYSRLMSRTRSSVQAGEQLESFCVAGPQCHPGEQRTELPFYYSNIPWFLRKKSPGDLSIHLEDVNNIYCSYFSYWKGEDEWVNACKEPWLLQKSTENLYYIITSSAPRKLWSHICFHLSNVNRDYYGYIKKCKWHREVRKDGKRWGSTGLMRNVQCAAGT